MTVLFAATVSGAAADTYAQEVDEGGIALTLGAVPDIEEGTAVILQGDAGLSGDRFFIENLAITQPVTVVLMAVDRPMTLNLSKYRYDESNRFGETGDSGSVAFNFRTQGELKMHVKPRDAESSGKARYFLIAWAGPDVRPDLPPPFVTRSVAAAGGGLSLWPWLLGAAVVAAAAFAVRMRRPRSSAASLVAAVALGLAGAWLPLPSAAQPMGFGSLGEMRAAAEATEADAADAADARAGNEAGRSAVDSGLDGLETGMNLYDSSRGFTEADANLDDVLHPDDGEFEPDYDPDGTPEVPVSCGGDDAAKCECYAEAWEQLSFIRFYLERLRAIYGATRNYTNSAIAFGDSMAGLHGGFGIAWPPERKSIQDAFDNTGKTYDQKYNEYMTGLRAALEAVASCEADYYGVEDWYNRFGFIYFSFMQDRYRR